MYILCRHLAPEYYLHGIVDEKTDVFAFGVILLELISGRKPVDGSHQSLHSWVTIATFFKAYYIDSVYFKLPPYASRILNLTSTGKTNIKPRRN